MKIYLYTENFDKERFDLYQYSEGRLELIEGDSPEYARLMAQIVNWECKSDVGECGVAASGGLCGLLGKKYVSFKVRINETAPCGRSRLIFGCAEPSLWWGENRIVEAVRLLLERLSLSISEERIHSLAARIEEAKRRTQLLIRRRQVSVAVSASVLIAGIITCKRIIH